MSQSTDSFKMASRLLKSYGSLKLLVALIYSLIVGGIVGGLLALTISIILGAASFAVVVLATFLVLYRRFETSIESYLKKYLNSQFVKSKNLRLINIVEGICLQLGIPEPKLLEIKCHAFVAGSFKQKKEVRFFFSESLLMSLDRLELEAVVAQLAARVDLKEVDSASFYSSVKLALGFLFPFKKDELICGPDATYFADRAAVLTTRYPPALISALQKICDINNKEQYLPSKCDRLFLVPLSTSAASVVSVQERVELLSDW